MKSQTYTHNIRIQENKFQNTQQNNQLSLDNIEKPQDIQKFNHANAVYCHISNKNKIWLGNLQAAENIQWLKQKNIKTVFTVGQGFKIKYDASIRHYKYSLYDNKNQKVYQYFDETSQKIDKALKFASVLVHCGAGVSRSTTFVIAFLIKYKKLTFFQALRMIKEKRPCVCPNLGFQLQLKAYSSYLNYEIPKQRNRRNLMLLQSQRDMYNKSSDLKKYISNIFEKDYKKKLEESVNRSNINLDNNKVQNDLNNQNNQKKKFNRKKKDHIKSTISFSTKKLNNYQKTDKYQKRIVNNTQRQNSNKIYQTKIYACNTDSELYQNYQNNFQQKKEKVIKGNINSFPQINKKQIISSLHQPQSILFKKVNKDKSKELSLSINIGKLRDDTKEKKKSTKVYPNQASKSNKYQSQALRNDVNNNYKNKNKKKINFVFKDLISQTKDIKLENHVFKDVNSYIKNKIKNRYRQHHYQNQNTPVAIFSQQYLKKIAQFRFGVENAEKWNAFHQKSS